MKKYNKEKAAKSFRRFLYKHFANQTDLANMLDVTPTAVNHWCSGKSRVPVYVIETVTNLLRTADVPAHLFRPDLYKRT